MVSALAALFDRRARARRRLKDPEFDFLFEPEPADEVVVFDTETTGLDRRRSEILSLAAIRIRGNRLMTGTSLRLTVRPAGSFETACVAIHQLRPIDVAGGIDAQDAVARFLRFVGSRALVGYYLEFDIAMVERVMRPWLAIGLPQRRIEISSLYYDRVMADPTSRDARYTGDVDLGFARILAGLDLPVLPAHDAFNDAVMAGLAYLKLRPRVDAG